MVSVFVTSRCLLSAAPALVLAPVCSGPPPPSPLSPSSSPALSPPAGFYRPGAPCTFYSENTSFTQTLKKENMSVCFEHFLLVVVRVVLVYIFAVKRTKSPGRG